MTIDDQLWDEMCRRTNFACVDSIAKKLKFNKSTVRAYLIAYYKRGLLDMTKRGSTKFYKVKD
jgi:Mn-dependent DtxR family transcriptional regulator